MPTYVGDNGILLGEDEDDDDGGKMEFICLYTLVFFVTEAKTGKRGWGGLKHSRGDHSPFISLSYLMNGNRLVCFGHGHD